MNFSVYGSSVGSETKIGLIFLKIIVPMSANMVLVASFGSGLVSGLLSDKVVFSVSDFITDFVSDSLSDFTSDLTGEGRFRINVSKAVCQNGFSVAAVSDIGP